MLYYFSVLNTFSNTTTAYCNYYLRLYNQEFCNFLKLYNYSIVRWSKENERILLCHISFGKGYLTISLTIAQCVRLLAC
jgi:hypothetical protein